MVRIRSKENEKNRILLIFIIVLLFPTFVYALDFPKTNSKIVEIYDLNDDKVLYEVDSAKKTSIASLTKIATVITAIENIKDLAEEVVITRDMLNKVSIEASRAGLRIGDKLTYKDLLMHQCFQVVQMRLLVLRLIVVVV